MDIQFVAQIDASADVVAFPVRKGEAGALGALLGAAAAQARFALADGKRDHVGRRIDLRDKLNVHALTFLCDD